LANKKENKTRHIARWWRQKIEILSDCFATVATGKHVKIKEVAKADDLVGDIERVRDVAR
jgi:hypothetical protein